MKHRVNSYLTLVTIALLTSTMSAQSAAVIPARFLPDDRAIGRSARDRITPEIASGGSFSDGGDYWGETAYHTFMQPGTHTISLTLFDNRGVSGTSRQQIVVQ
jgi:hypothetical protein